jgi:hypothetical protein
LQEERFSKDSRIEKTAWGVKATNDENITEIRWLNKKREAGKGYDFVVRVNNIATQ